MSASSINCEFGGQNNTRVTSWVNDIAYTEGAVACYFGKGYEVIVAHNYYGDSSGAALPTNSSYWSRHQGGDACCSCSLNIGCASATATWGTNTSYDCNFEILASSPSPSASPSPSPSASPSGSPARCSLNTGCASATAAWGISTSYECNAVVTQSSQSPSGSPSPSASPSASPSVSPSASPSGSPSASPSASPSTSPSASPSAAAPSTTASSGSCCRALSGWLSGAYYSPNQVVKNKIRVTIGGTP